MKLKATDPGKVEFTMTMTFMLEDWKRLREDLATSYPAWKVGNKIDDLVRQAEQTYMPAPEDD